MTITLTAKNLEALNKEMVEMAAVQQEFEHDYRISQTTIDLVMDMMRERIIKRLKAYDVFGPMLRDELRVDATEELYTINVDTEKVKIRKTDKETVIWHNGVCLWRAA